MDALAGISDTHTMSFSCHFNLTRVEVIRCHTLVIGKFHRLVGNLLALLGNARGWHHRLKESVASAFHFDKCINISGQQPQCLNLLYHKKYMHVPCVVICPHSHRLIPSNTSDKSLTKSLFGRWNRLNLGVSTYILRCGKSHGEPFRTH